MGAGNLDLMAAGLSSGQTSCIAGLTRI